MEKDFHDKIVEEINKSGFPLELEVLETLRNRRALTFSNVSFQDSHGNIHEIDMFSIVSNEDNEWSIGPTGIQMIIECKKTEKYPWVFFEEPYNPINALGLLFMADYSTDLKFNADSNPLVGCMNSPLSDHHYNSYLIPKSIIYFEAFKKPNEPTSIYKALNGIFHGRQYFKDWFCDSNKSSEKTLRTFLNHYVIVIDGRLLLASKGKASFEISEPEQISLQAVDTVGQQNKILFGNQIIVDVVKKEYVSKYLDTVHHEADLFNQHLDLVYKAGLLDIK